MSMNSIREEGTEILWIYEQAIELAKQFEPICVKYNCHIAIGGSVVYKGWSDNDLDFILYPHSGNGLVTDYIACINDFPNVTDVVSCSQYVVCACEENHIPKFPSQKSVYMGIISNKPINFICINRV